MSNNYKTWSTLAHQIRGTGSLTPSGGTIQNFHSTGYQITFNNKHYPAPPHYRSGNMWLLQKTDKVCGFPEVVKKNGAGTSILYKGTAGPRHHGYTAPPGPPIISDGQMDTDGATAMSRVLPTSPNAELLLAFSELLRDGLPSAGGAAVWEEVTRQARRKKRKKSDVVRDRVRGASNEYVDANFGLVPFASDLSATIDATRKASELIDQFMKDSERVIRRSYFFPATTSTQTYVSNGFGYPTDAAIQWTGSTTVRRDTNKWFEGAFMYHIPGGEDFASQLRRVAAQANHLYGVRPTPEVVWNASPWTWALDWFTNIGDVMKNISLLGSDGLTLLYGYMMQSEVVTETTNAVSQSLNGKTYQGSLQTIRTVKQRRVANPYGFGATGLATSLRQKSVVAAIAASRGKSSR